MSTKDERKGWHLLAANKRLGYLDRREVELGVRMEMQYRSGTTGRLVKAKYPPYLCTCGMHASDKVYQAMKYSDESLLCRVLVEEDLVVGDDKFCGRYRTVLGWVPLEEIAIQVYLELAEKKAASLKDGPALVQCLRQMLKTRRPVPIPPKSRQSNLRVSVGRVWNAIGYSPARDLLYQAMNWEFSDGWEWVNKRIEEIALKRMGIEED